MNKKIIRICGLISGVSGIMIILSFLLPIALYISEARQNYPELANPVSSGSTGLLSLISGRDLTNPDNWFDNPPSTPDMTSSGIKYYTITVPKLKIENAVVTIGGENLSDSLIQYPGTAIPGKVGNSVIFGHSILPIFYNPKNYISIFSTLNKLVVGNEIYVNIEGVSYKFIVEDKFEVKPTDTYVLNQNFNDAYISLITCSPAGHPSKPKRLIVLAKIV